MQVIGSNAVFQKQLFTDFICVNIDKMSNNQPSGLAGQISFR
jgi:hypothetical protein